MDKNAALEIAELVRENFAVERILLSVPMQKGWQLGVKLTYSS